MPMPVKTEQPQKWLQQYNVLDLSRCLVRQYLIQNDYFDTLKVFENEDTANNRKISKSKLVNMLCINNLIFYNQHSKEPYKALLQILVSYLLNKFKQKLKKTSLQQKAQINCINEQKYNLQIQIKKSNQDIIVKKEEAPNVEQIVGISQNNKVNVTSIASFKQQIYQSSKQQNMGNNQNNNQFILEVKKVDNSAQTENSDSKRYQKQHFQKYQLQNSGQNGNNHLVQLQTFKPQQLESVELYKLKENKEEEFKKVKVQINKTQKQTEITLLKEISGQQQSTQKVNQQPKKQKSMMIKVGGRKKAKQKKQSQFPQLPQYQKPTNKFQFEQNFKDIPFRPVEQDYIYEKFNFYNIKINQTDETKELNIIIKPDISYQKKPIINDSKKMQKSISTEQAKNLKQILFQDNTPILPKSWQQGFILSPYYDTPYGLKQIQGGPCGIIAAVQCYFLKHLFYCSELTNSEEMENQDRRQICLIAAIADILMKVKSSKEIILVIPPKNFMGCKVDITSLVIIRVDAQLFKNVFQKVWLYRMAFLGKTNYGIAMLLYSIILTKSVNSIYEQMYSINEQMGSKNIALIGLHGHCTQQLINLFITGYAVTNIFDGDKTLQGYCLHGIKKRSQFGFLTIFEALKQIEVGSYLKCPFFPIWVISKQYHYHVIFAGNHLIAKNKKCQKFDMIYFDGLYNCADRIRLTVKNKEQDNSEKIKLSDMALIEVVMLTRWGQIQVDWNGSTKIL